MAASAAVAGISYASPRGRFVLAAAVLGSGMAFLDGTVVNIALPTIGREFNASLAGLQWTVNAYTLTLSGFLLLGGALGDRYGRRRIFTIGAAWFALASLACAVAPGIGVLIAARALQGVGGAMLTPGSLALIRASFRPDDRGAAIGAWSGLVGVAGALGPFLGGWLITAVSWRLIFLINLPIAVVVIMLARRHVPESLDPERRGTHLDVAGAVLAAAALGGVTLALTGLGWVVAIPGIAAAVAFVVVERRSAAPLVPGRVVREREFVVANLLTLVVYAALGTLLFLVPLQLQTVLGYSPLQAGTALVPLTVVMLLLSARGGKLAARIGPRIPLTVGPIVIGIGMALLSRISAGDTYVQAILPAVLVLALGLSGTVAPLTTTVLAAAPARDAGVASAINNAVARAAGLIAVSLIPVVTGLSAADYLNPSALSSGFRTGMLAAAVLAVCGGVVAFVGIRTRESRPVERPCHSCPLDAPPLQGAEEAA
jgi:EmrB/QacA subfamily drug resistance transporter